jgi:hypothetical protein
VTSAAVAELVGRIGGYNHAGVPVFVRFGHEMNGSWYPWSQDPDAYVKTFRRVAVAVHAGAPGSAMVWAPNYGGGYPFAGGQHQARPHSAAAKSLDTNGDGRVSGHDDPYAPYWPGPGFVDWVGMSLYHWGARYPWGENEVPEAGKFTALLRGTYRGVGGDERAVPDFYGRYAVKFGLPVAITETAAFYDPAAEGATGAREVAVKSAWWRQVFAPDHAEKLPMVKMVNWFEWDKFEPEVRTRVDWAATRTPRTAELFAAALPAWAKYGSQTPRCH